MSKDNLVVAANTSAVAGTGTGFFSYLADNSSPITVIVVVLTLIVTFTFHLLNYIRQKKKDKEELELANKNHELEKKRIDLQMKLAENRSKINTIET